MITDMVRMQEEVTEASAHFHGLLLSEVVDIIKLTPA